MFKNKNKIFMKKKLILMTFLEIYLRKMKIFKQKVLKT